MKYKRDIYVNHKSALSKLISANGLESMSNDVEVIDRIFNLLTENLNVSKIEGIIQTTEILKYGGDIEDKKVKEVYYQILDWWNENRI